MRENQVWRLEVKLRNLITQTCRHHRKVCLLILCSFSKSEVIESEETGQGAGLGKNKYE